MMRLDFRGSRRFLSESVKTYAAKRLMGLGKILGNNPSGESRVTLWINKISGKHTAGNIWQAKANLSFSGELLRAESVGPRPQSALDKLKDELKREIVRFRGRIRSRLMRGSRQAKKELHLARAARFWRKGRIRDEAR